MSSDDGSIQLCLSLFYTPLPQFSLLHRTPAIDKCDINGNNLYNVLFVLCLLFLFQSVYSVYLYIYIYVDSAMVKIMLGET